MMMQQDSILNLSFPQILTNANCSWLHLCSLSGNSVIGKRPAVDAHMDPCGCLGPGQVGPGFVYPSEMISIALLHYKEGREDTGKGRHEVTGLRWDLRHPDCRPRCPMTSAHTVHFLDCRGAVLWTCHLMATVSSESCFYGAWPPWFKHCFTQVQRAEKVGQN